jgi:hypothetical protein
MPRKVTEMFSDDREYLHWQFTGELPERPSTALTFTQRISMWLLNWF